MQRLNALGKAQNGNGALTSLTSELFTSVEGSGARWGHVVARVKNALETR